MYCSNGHRLARLSAKPSRGATIATGSVKFFRTCRRYGFIQPSDSSPDVFVHISVVQCAGRSHLAGGQKVSFDVTRIRNRRDHLTFRFPAADFPALVALYKLARPEFGERGRAVDRATARQRRLISVAIFVLGAALRYPARMEILIGSPGPDPAGQQVQ